MTTASARQRPRLLLLPQTRAGWYAVYCFIAFAVTSAVSGAITAAVGGSPWMAVFTVPFALFALGAGVFVFLAVVRRGDRALVLALPVLLALVALFFVVGEFVAPH